MTEIRPINPSGIANRPIVTQQRGPSTGDRAIIEVEPKVTTGIDKVDRKHGISEIKHATSLSHPNKDRAAKGNFTVGIPGVPLGESGFSKNTEYVSSHEKLNLTEATLFAHGA